jgi:uncharacterized membrane protein
MSPSIRSITGSARWVVLGVFALAGAAWAGSQSPTIQRLQLAKQWLQQQAELQAALHLSPTQEIAWQALQNEQRELFRQGREQLSDAAAIARIELAEPDADLAGLAASLETEVDLWMADQRALRARKLAFYETLSPEQQVVLRDELVRRIERAEALRDTLLQIAVAAP